MTNHNHNHNHFPCFRSHSQPTFTFTERLLWVSVRRASGIRHRLVYSIHSNVAHKSKAANSQIAHINYNNNNNDVWSKCFEILRLKAIWIGSELIISRLEIGRLHSDQNEATASSLLCVCIRLLITLMRLFCWHFSIEIHLPPHLIFNTHTHSSSVSYCFLRSRSLSLAANQNWAQHKPTETDGWCRILYKFVRHNFIFGIMRLAMG